MSATVAIIVNSRINNYMYHHKVNHFVQKLWKTRDGYTLGEKNVINESSFTKEKIILAPAYQAVIND